MLTAGELGFDLPDSYRYAVHVAAGVTHTVGGLKVDNRARVLDEGGSPIDGLCAAGVDAGGDGSGRLRERPGDRARARHYRG